MKVHILKVEKEDDPSDMGWALLLGLLLLAVPVASYFVIFA